jgi:hypothetical protein
LWIIKNQLGRRNLQAIDRVPLIERQRGIREAQAKLRMIATLAKGNEFPAPIQVSERGKHEVREQLAKQAGVGHSTYTRLVEVTEKGTPELIEAVRNKEIGAENAAVIASLPKEEQNEVFIGKERTEVKKRAEAIRGVKPAPKPAAPKPPRKPEVDETTAYMQAVDKVSVVSDPGRNRRMQRECNATPIGIIWRDILLLDGELFLVAGNELGRLRFERKYFLTMICERDLLVR